MTLQKTECHVGFRYQLRNDSKDNVWCHFVIDLDIYMAHLHIYVVK